MSRVQGALAEKGRNQISVPFSFFCLFIICQILHFQKKKIAICSPFSADKFNSIKHLLPNRCLLLDAFLKCRRAPAHTDEKKGYPCPCYPPPALTCWQQSLVRQLECRVGLISFRDPDARRRSPSAFFPSFENMESERLRSRPVRSGNER